MVGAMSNFLAVNKQVFLDVIATRVKETFREVNKKAFEMGRKLVYS
jgi:indolepyruvate ferredoxin oxidoreductase beta subunit